MRVKSQKLLTNCEHSTDTRADMHKCESKELIMWERQKKMLIIILKITQAIGSFRFDNLNTFELSLFSNFFNTSHFPLGIWTTGHSILKRAKFVEIPHFLRHNAFKAGILYIFHFLPDITPRNTTNLTVYLGWKSLNHNFYRIFALPWRKTKTKFILMLFSLSSQ